MPTKLSKTKQHSSNQGGRPTAFDMPDLASLAWPLDQWLRFQAELLRATEPSLTGWLNRRRDGAAALLRSVEKLARCRDIDEAIAIQSEWLDAALRRLDLDARAAMEQALAVSQCAAGATRQAAQTTTEMATKGAEWLVRKSDSDARPPELQGVPVNPPMVSKSATEPPIATQAAA